MRVFECYCSRLFPHLLSSSVCLILPIAHFLSLFLLFFPLLLIFLSSLTYFLPLDPSLTLCLSPCVPPSRCCSIFKRACSAQVILAAAGEGSDKSLMVEKRVCGTLGTQQQYMQEGGKMEEGGDGETIDREAVRKRRGGLEVGKGEMKNH